MAVKLKVDKDACIGCGSCVGAYPESFALDSDGKAECIKPVDNAEDAKSNCPVGAISE